MAEVLITLGIIGVVAALTIPNMIQKHREKEYSAKLKKFYSDMENAGRQVENEWGSINDWSLIPSFVSDDTSGDEVKAMLDARDIYIDRYSKYLKLVSRDYYTNSSSMKRTTYAMDKKTVLSNSHRDIAVLSNGLSIIGVWLNGSCTSDDYCGDFAIDLNGGKVGPNAVGRDIFLFIITHNGIKPLGLPNSNLRPFNQYCNYNSHSMYNGYGCTAWVIYNENMDYLHCNDLSWNGKRKCK